MITVRFPSGYSVQYNDAGYAVRSADGYTDLYTDSTKTRWVAQVPTAACIVEVVRPCRAYGGTVPTPDEAAEAILANPRALPSYRARELKRALSRFNARRGAWV